MTTHAIPTEPRPASGCCCGDAGAAAGMSPSEHQAVAAVLEKHPRDARVLVQLLQDLQKRLHWVPKEAMRAVAAHLQVPLSKVYAVATFYKAFSLVPRGEHLVRVCTGTACHVRGSALVAEELQKHLGIRPGQTTADMRFSLEAVNCVGACALAPVVMVNDEVHGAVAPGDTPEILPKGRP